MPNKFSLLSKCTQAFNNTYLLLSSWHSQLCTTQFYTPEYILLIELSFIVMSVFHFLKYTTTSFFHKPVAASVGSDSTSHTPASYLREPVAASVGCDTTSHTPASSLREPVAASVGCDTTSYTLASSHHIKYNRTYQVKKIILEH